MNSQRKRSVSPSPAPVGVSDGRPGSSNWPAPLVRNQAGASEKVTGSKKGQARMETEALVEEIDSQLMAKDTSGSSSVENQYIGITGDGKIIIRH